MKKSLLIVSIVSIYLVACKCDKKTVISALTPDMYDYLFKDTSIWVYRNTTTNVEDTVTVYGIDNTLLRQDTSDKCIDLKKQVYYMHFVSSLNPSSNTFFFVDNNGVRLNGIGNAPYWGQEIYNRLTTVGDSTIYTVYEGSYPFLIIEGHAAYNVRKMLLLYPSADYPNKTYLYWAPDLGIVRKEIHDSINGVLYWDLKYSSLKYY